MPEPLELRRIQQWLQTVITHPDGVAAGVDSADARRHVATRSEQVEEVIARSQALTSLKRLNVYGNAYYARLLECLRDEFPALAHALGEETFDGFAFGYLQDYPSQSYTLAKLGRSFPQYLATTRPAREGDDADWADFLIDLATLERTYAEVFDGEGFEGRGLISPEELAAIPPERFAEVRLVPVPCLRLLKLRFPVHDYATAVRRKESPTIPAARDTWLAITRREYVVRRQPVSQAQFAVLSALAAGEPLGAAIGRALEAAPAAIDQLADELQTWFRTWAAAGYFERVEIL